jgi:surface antigen
MRASEEADREVLIVKREAAQRAAIEVEERQKREFEERAYAVKQKEGQMTAMAAVTSRPITLVAPITPVARSSSNSNYSSGGGGQCTDYATAKTGIGGLGNASQWAANAQSKGYNVSKTPKAGDVVVFAPGQAGASSLGHVGVVDSVNENGTINMSEANYNGGFNKRTVSSAAADGFISSN